MSKIMVFGAFDGIHLGHLYYLKRAKKYGKLVVTIARDRAAWRPRPNYGFSEIERKKLVEELGIADKVILGGMKSAFEKIKKIKPDYIAITPFHHVDEEILQEDLKHHGLSTKVIMFPMYKPEIYKQYFGFDIKRVPKIMKLKIKKSF
jgi:FAD synthetase